ncbi:hypothetical protein [Alienimonas californiensis]|uniref:Uncharacterized protein n=1 Tax=Alienimonas californiensis TaxID=2527989 RepID=A0A517PFP1_9PLAN|nr:hypothetical protein [Alienimonas californiensis]QDT18164.1 hypothetical protein CA12_43050 [Alienimonas californiensis]
MLHQPAGPVPVPVVALRLGQCECRNDLECRFLERLDDRANCGGSYADSWSHTTDHALIAISLVRDNCVYRDLRADFLGDRLLVGYDETHQFGTPLDAARPGVTEVVLPTPEAMAEAAADWFERELAADAAARAT